MGVTEDQATRSYKRSIIQNVHHLFPVLTAEQVLNNKVNKSTSPSHENPHLLSTVSRPWHWLNICHRAYYVNLGI